VQQQKGQQGHWQEMYELFEMYGGMYGMYELMRAKCNLVQNPKQASRII
jgi:hypothetical protein